MTRNTMLRLLVLTILLAVKSLCHGIEDNLELLISPQEISVKIQEIAMQINREYADRPLTVLITMKGALCVSADLIRAIDIPCKVEYLSASSYGNNGMHAGE